MKHPLAPKTPTKDNESPRPFVKPADLFKMRRRPSNANSNSTSSPLTFGSRSVKVENHGNSDINNCGNINNNSSSNSCSTPNKNLLPGTRMSPLKFEQSPLKCLNNISDPSPSKKLPVLLRNPFNKPSAVKRRLNLSCSPRKDGLSRSPTKMAKVMEMDEDANLEPPKMKHTKLMHKDPKANGPCDANDWTLRTKVKINFWTYCKNWNNNSTSIHKRRTGISSEESPSKLDDNSISIEAIKNAAIVYQHPYLSWQPMYPRVNEGFEKKKDKSFALTKHSQVAKLMHKDWCESFTDLTNLLIGGRCPYFYMCSDLCNILFKQIPSSNPKAPHVQAHISPFYFNLGCELNKQGVEFKCPGIVRHDSSSALSGMAKECSQASFGSTRNSVLIEEESSQSICQSGKKVTPSVDSGNASDLEDELDDDENDASQCLESIGLSIQEFPNIQVKQKGFITSESNTQTKSTSIKDLAVIEGTENLRKLVNFLQTNRRYTISNVGKFACIPPTLLSPREFRLSTPQYPEVLLNNKMNDTTAANKLKKLEQEAGKSSSQNNETIGNTCIELKGTILPNLYTELHKLLTISDNVEHTCSSTPLESSIAFKNIQFN